MPHASHCRNRTLHSHARTLGIAASLLTLFATIITGTARAQTSPDPNDANSESPSPAPTSAEEPRLVWTEVTTESGTMMVLRPADDAAAPTNSAISTPETAPSQDLTAYPAPDRSRPALEGDRFPNQTAYPGGAPPYFGVSSFGVYGGFPSAVGFQFVIPTDATLAFRTGFTGLPGIGYLLTPGVEIRFNQSPGTYNIDSAYAFSNLYIGETVEDGPNTHHWGVENGLGYRWILPDRRGVRWVGAVEFGGRWSTESVWPIKPSVRAFWMIAAP